MPWFKVDDQLAFNAKVVAAGNEAMGLWVRCGSWSSAQLTDGFIPTHMANAMANGMAKECGADALVMAGLWDEVEGGYQFHDWSEFQPSASSEREKRRKRSLAGQKGAEARWGDKSDGKPHGKSHNDRMANECEVDAPSRPVPSSSLEAASPPESKSRKRPSTPLPDDWTYNETHEAKARENNLDVSIEARNFRDNAGAKDLRYVDWGKAFHTWLNRANDFKPNSTSKPQTDLWNREGPF